MSRPSQLCIPPTDDESALDDGAAEAPGVLIMRSYFVTCPFLRKKVLTCFKDPDGEENCHEGADVAAWFDGTVNFWHVHIMGMSNYLL